MMSVLGKLFHILLVIAVTPIWSFEDDPFLLSPTLTVANTLEFDGVEVEDRNSSEVYTTGDMVRDEDHPLVILLATRPHSMVLKIKPKPENIRNHTVIRCATTHSQYNKYWCLLTVIYYRLSRRYVGNIVFVVHLM